MGIVKSYPSTTNHESIVRKLRKVASAVIFDTFSLRILELRLKVSAYLLMVPFRVDCPQAFLIIFRCVNHIYKELGCSKLAKEQIDKHQNQILTIYRYLHCGVDSLQVKIGVPG